MQTAQQPIEDTGPSVYQPDQEGLIFPEIPSFDNIQDERLHLKKQLVAACRAFAMQGFDYGFAGHLTIRDPENTHHYWTNPMAVHFSQVKLSNLILVDREGKIIDGDYAVNRAGFVLHASVHDAHPDIVAMCHAHTPYGTAFAALGHELLPISQDSAAFYGDHVVIKEEAGQVVVKKKSGQGIAAEFTGVKAAIHQNHGLFTASRHSIESAAFWFIALERCCQQQLLVNASGHKPNLITPENANYSRKHVGSEYIGWLHFQPILGQLLATETDMFD